MIKKGGTVAMEPNKHTIIVYGLSSCVHCKRVLKFLHSQGLVCQEFLVDTYSGEQRAQLLRSIKKHNPKLSFPTILIDDHVVIGDNIKELETALSLVALLPTTFTEKTVTSSPEVDSFIKRMAPIQEKQGYFFNEDSNFTKDLVEQLLQRKDTSGYMACPCRLASGNREEDKDIICPCAYRASDVEEYGICYCGLYTSETPSKAPSAGKIVPEQRPAKKIP